MRTAAAAVGLAPAAFWSLAILGLFISIPVVFQVGDLTVLAAALGGLDPYLLVGNLGTLVAVVVFFQSRARFADDSLDSIAPAQTSMSAVLRNGAKETSSVITWVALTYVVYETAVGVTGFNAASLAGVGVAGVLVGAVVGLVPGCAIQIVFTGLYWPVACRCQHCWRTLSAKTATRYCPCSSPIAEPLPPRQPSPQCPHWSSG